MSVETIAASAGVRIIETKKRRGLRETQAVAAIGRIAADHGQVHAVKVLRMLAGGRHAAHLWSEIILAVSAVMAKRPDLATAEEIEGIDLAAMRQRAKRLRAGPTPLVLTVLLMSHLLERGRREKPKGDGIKVPIVQAPAGEEAQCIAA